MVNYTSIQIMPKTRERLSYLKQNERETYDDVLNKLLQLVPAGDDEGQYTNEFRIGLLNARLEQNRKRGTGHKEVKLQLGL